MTTMQNTYKSLLEEMTLPDPLSVENLSVDEQYKFLADRRMDI